MKLIYWLITFLEVLELYYDQLEVNPGNTEMEIKVNLELLLYKIESEEEKNQRIAKLNEKLSNFTSKEEVEI